MQLKCPNCATVIAARQINVDKLVAVCEKCDAVFSVNPATLPTSERKRRKVPQPEKFELKESAGKLEMSYLFRDHFGWLEAIMIFIIGLINIAALIGLGASLSNGEWLTFVGLMVLNPFLLYVLASYFTNGHIITLDSDKLTAQETPLRTYILDAELNTHDIMRVFTKRAELDDNPANDYYHVRVQMFDQSERNILHYIKRQNAEFIVQMLNESIQGDNNLLENPLFDDEDFREEADESVLGEGEIIGEEATDDTPLSLDDLLQEDQETRRYRSTDQ